VERSGSIRLFARPATRLPASAFHSSS
jgi:hypothetical protein